MNTERKRGGRIPKLSPKSHHVMLSSFHSQYRMIGNNYNQVVKELRCHFSEKKAMALLYKLENCTRELVSLTREIVELTRKFEERWSQR